MLHLFPGLTTCWPEAALVARLEKWTKAAPLEVAKAKEVAAADVVMVKMASTGAMAGSVEAAGAMMVAASQAGTVGSTEEERLVEGQWGAEEILAEVMAAMVTVAEFPEVAEMAQATLEAAVWVVAFPAAVQMVVGR